MKTEIDDTTPVFKVDLVKGLESLIESYRVKFRKECGSYLTEICTTREMLDYFCQGDLLDDYHKMTDDLEVKRKY